MDVSSAVWTGLPEAGPLVVGCGGAWGQTPLGPPLGRRWAPILLESFTPLGGLSARQMLPGSRKT